MPVSSRNDQSHGCGWVSSARRPGQWLLCLFPATFAFVCALHYRMREIKNTYNHIQNIRSRASTVIKDLEKKNELNAVIKHEILSAKSIDAIDHLVSGKWCDVCLANAMLYIFWTFVDSMHHSRRPARRRWPSEQKRWVWVTPPNPCWTSPAVCRCFSNLLVRRSMACSTLIKLRTEWKTSFRTRSAKTRTF